MTDPNDDLGDTLLDGDRSEIEMGESELNRDAFIAAMAAYNDPIGNYDNVPGSVEAAIIAYIAAAPRPSVSPEIEASSPIYGDAHPGAVKTPQLLRQAAAAIAQRDLLSGEVERLKLELGNVATADVVREVNDENRKLRAEVERLTRELADKTAYARLCLSEQKDAEAVSSALAGEVAELRKTNAEMFRIGVFHQDRAEALSGEVERLKALLMKVHDWFANVAFDATVFYEADAIDAAIVDALQKGEHPNAPD